MRTRLSRSDRRDEILNKARQLFLERGLAETEMEDIRLACGISRGGLYHHFSNKRAVLHALVESEVAVLAAVLDDDGTSPIPALLRAGAGHLGNEPGVLPALQTSAEKLDYLSALETAFASVLKGPLCDQLTGRVRRETDPNHICELFLTINAHINRRQILGDWTGAEAAGFAATSLEALAPFLKDPKELAPIIKELKNRATAS